MNHKGIRNDHGLYISVTHFRYPKIYVQPRGCCVVVKIQAHCILQACSIFYQSDAEFVKVIIPRPEIILINSSWTIIAGNKLSYSGKYRQTCQEKLKMLLSSREIGPYESSSPVCVWIIVRG